MGLPVADVKITLLVPLAGIVILVVVLPVPVKVATSVPSTATLASSPQPPKAE